MRLLRGSAGIVFALAVGMAPARAADDLVGELKTVGEVRLEGVRSVPKRELRSAMKTRAGSTWPWTSRPSLRLDFLRADTANIAGLYRHHGFLDARVAFDIEPMRQKDRVRVRFRVEEGARTRVVEVRLIGVAVYPEGNLRRRLLARPGRPFSPAYLQLDTLAISAAYQEQGYRPHTTARMVREGNRVSVTYEVTEGTRYRFGETYVAGLEHAREKLVRRELVLTPGQPFRLSRVRQSVERLYESGLFDRVQVSPIPDSTNSQILFYVLVHERKRRWLDGGLGTGTSERFRFTGEWGHRNLAGLGLQGAMKGRLALDAQGRFLLSRGETSLLSPWVFRTRIPARLTVYFEQKDDRADARWLIRQRTQGVALELRRYLNRLTSVSITQDNSAVDQDLTYTQGVVPTPEVSDSLRQFFVEHYSTHRVQLAFERDFRDHPFNTRQGSRQLVSAELAGGPVLGGSSFEKYALGSTWYTPLGANVVLAARLRGGVIRPFGNRFFSPPEFVDEQVRRVPLEDRFRLGGVNSVRGYDENAIASSGGLALLNANLELRVALLGPLGGEFFLDGGNVWARPEYIRAKDFWPAISTDRLDPAEVRYTAGAGLRFNLPVGPLRLDWAWALRNPASSSAATADPRPLIGRWQFAIGPSF